MSNEENLLYNFRLKAGYIKPGETNKNYMRINFLLFLILIPIVAIFWNIYRNDKKDLSNSEENWVLTIAVFSTFLLLLFISPYKFADYFANGITSHPIYAYYAIVGLVLLAFIGVFYSTWAKNNRQKSYAIAAMICVGIFVLGSFILWYCTSFPYNFITRLLGLDMLSDSDYTNINPELYIKLSDAKRLSESAERILNNTGTDQQFAIAIDEINEVYKIDLKKDNIEQKRFLLTQIKENNKIKVNNYKKQLYNLGNLKSVYDKITTKNLNSIDFTSKDNDKVLRDKMITELNKFSSSRKGRKILAQIDTDLIKELQEYTQVSKNGLLDTEQYSKIFGYYSSSGAYITNAKVGEFRKRESDLKTQLLNDTDKFVFETTVSTVYNDLVNSNNINDLDKEIIKVSLEKDIKDFINNNQSKDKADIPNLYSNNLRDKINNNCKSIKSGNMTKWEPKPKEDEWNPQNKNIKKVVDRENKINADAGFIGIVGRFNAIYNAINEEINKQSVDDANKISRKNKLTEMYTTRVMKLIEECTK